MVPVPLKFTQARVEYEGAEPVAVESAVAVAALPVVLWFKVGKEQFVSVPEAGVPSAGVTSVGLVDKTLLPEPVEVVTPVPPRNTGKVLIVPASIGSPVQLVSVPEVGVPKIGVTRVGLVDSTLLPEPVEVVTPVPPRNTGKVLIVPASIGRPVAFVNVPEAGVPKIGVTRVGLVDRTVLPEPVEVVTPVPPRVTGKVLIVPPSIGRPTAFVKVPEAGVPSTALAN
jgi:hypothetical protein